MKAQEFCHGPQVESAATNFLDAAKRVYEERWRTQLEATNFGNVIALEPESGDYVLGRDFREVDVAARQRFGSKPVYIFRVGGGGAVRIGGAATRGRLLGRV